MSIIDNITVILGPPADQAEKDRIAQEGAASDISFDDAYIARIAGIVTELTARADGAASDMERFFSELLEQPVRLAATTPTWFEKKGQRFPAIMVAARDVIDAEGNTLQQAVTEAFTRPETPARLSGLIGMRLELESAKTFYTFGNSG